jgi:hypothetical protein
LLPFKLIVQAGCIIFFIAMNVVLWLTLNFLRVDCSTSFDPITHVKFSFDTQLIYSTSLDTIVVMCPYEIRTVS